MKQMEHESYSGNIAAAATQSVKEREYWLDKLAGNPGKSSFPYDFEKNLKGPGQRETLNFQVSGEVFSRLLWISNESDARLLVILSAGVILLLNKYGGTRDIIVGMPIYKQDVKGEGNFINTVLALRCELHGDMTFKEFLYRVKQTIDEAVKNQNYPIKALLYDLNLPFSQEDFPLFDITVMLENVQERKYIQHIPGNMGFSFLRTGECLEGTVEYNRSLYDKETVERIAACFIHLVGEAIFNADARLAHIDLLPGEERKKLLADFNDTRKPDREWQDKGLHQLFEDQAQKTPDHIALVFDADVLTYREYNRRAHSLARVLKEKGAGAEGIIAILMESSLEMVIVIMAVLKTGAAYLPIDREIPGERKAYMLKESGAGLLLTDDEQYAVSSYVPAGIAVVTACDRYDDGKENTNPEFFTNSANLAYIIYTSGSTGKPKGVMVEHRQAVNTLVCRRGEYCMTTDDTVLQLFSYAFDGFITSFFTPVISGARVVLLSKQRIEDIEKIIRVTVNCCVTHFICIPVLYRVILDSIRETGITGLKLKRVTLAGDKVPPNILEISASEHKDIEIVNEYGITEAAVMSTLYRNQARDGQVKIGRPAWNTAVYITGIGNHRQLVPIGIYGEMCIAGAGVTRGYMNNPEGTAAKFVKNPFAAGRGMLKTGDLARWLPDGNIEFGGRMDHQVKIRGFRIEPGEIENRLLGCDGIKEAVVIATGGASDKYLCAYFVSGKETDLSLLRDNLAKNLPEYMIPAYFMQVERIPLTPNGKVDRKALPEPGVRIGKDHIAPRNKIEEKLAEIWSDVLGIEKELIGIDSNFFEVGGHSLKATVLVSRVHKIFDVRVSMTDVFERTTLRELAEFISDSVKDKYASIEPAKNKDYYVLSSAQKRLYVLQQIKPESPGYNIPLVVQLEGGFDVLRLENVFRMMIERHESLRTSFGMAEEEPVQRIHPAHEVQFAVKHYDISNSSTNSGHQTGRIEKIIADFVRPFDLSGAPLLRVGMIKVEEKHYVLMLDMHHIISDEISLDIFERELRALYNGEELPGLRLHYKDFSEWQNSSTVKALIKQQESYWLKKFEGSIPVLDLPVDYPRPAVRSFEGRSLVFHVGGEEAKALKELALRQGATMYMALLAVFNVLLAKISLREDIIVGTPVAGRRHADLEKIIGFFVNTLALRNDPSGEKTFAFFLHQVKENTLAAFENQDYQFEDLVEKVELERDMSRNPLFDVVFNFQSVFAAAGNVPPADAEEPDAGTELKIKHYPYENRTAKFDLTLTAGEERDKLGLSFHYSTRIFREETVKRFVNYFKRIISTVVENPGLEISEIEIITEEEKKQALYDFNDTRAEYPGDKTTGDLFQERVKKMPFKTALVYDHNHLTYQKLDDKTNQLASHLRSRGVKPDTITGLMLDPSLEMITAILGIVKAGGAYLPIDSRYPPERVQYILGDSNTGILITQGALMDYFKKITFEGDIIDIFDDRLYLGNFHRPENRTAPGSLAYVMYTSGSTGRPKGVMVKQKNVVRLVKNSNYIDFTGGDKLLLTGVITFDITTFEIWWPLLNGLTLFLVHPEVVLDVHRLGEVLARKAITILHLIPQLLNQFADRHAEMFAGLKYLLVGGDIVSPRYIDKVRDSYKSLKILHMYGPTENTTFSTFFPVDKTGAAPMPIGKPVGNSTVYIVDKYNKLLPIRTAAGELCVGGDGIARGYVNNPGLTHEKFIQNPFVPGEKMYRTGDLARWLSDGNIEFLGREDHQVKIRGIRIELGEIENQLLGHGNIKEAVVIDRLKNAGSTEGSENEKYLCAYIVPHSVEAFDTNTSMATELREYLYGRLLDVMIPSYFVLLDKIPVMPNGKIDRRALPKPGIKAEDLFIAPRDEVEEKLARIWSGVLGIEKDIIGIDSNFFRLGGHSLKATIIAARIHKELEVKLPLAELFNTPTIRELSERLQVLGLKQDKYISIEPVEKKEYYPVSSAQKRLYLLQTMDPDLTVYNMPEVLQLEGNPEKEKLEKTFKKLILRHESLRTGFFMLKGEPVQRVYDDVEFDIQQPQGPHLPTLEIISNFVRPFDPARAPLLRAAVIPNEDKTFILVTDMHHIISDGVSCTVLVDEFIALHRDRHLPDLRLHYKDFSQWQLQSSGSGEMKKQEEFWLKEFSGELPDAALPMDYARPDARTFAGDTVRFVINPKETAALNRLAGEENATLFMLMLGIYNVLLSKLSDKQDIIVGTGVAGRRHADLEKIIGMFVNTLALRNYPRENQSFNAFIREVAQRTLRAFENQDYLFEDLVKKVVNNRPLNRHPLFDTIFMLLDLEDGNREAPGTEISEKNPGPYDYQMKISKFDMSFYCSEVGDKLFFTVEYCTGLFKKETVELFTGYFQEIVSIVLENKEIKLKDIFLSKPLEAVKPAVMEEEEGDFGF